MTKYLYVTYNLEIYPLLQRKKGFKKCQAIAKLKCAWATIFKVELLSSFENVYLADESNRDTLEEFVQNQSIVGSHGNLKIA